MNWDAIAGVGQAVSAGLSLGVCTSASCAFGGKASHYKAALRQSASMWAGERARSRRVCGLSAHGGALMGAV